MEVEDTRARGGRGGRAKDGDGFSGRKEVEAGWHFEIGCVCLASDANGRQNQMVGDADFLKQFRFWSRDQRFSTVFESAMPRLKLHSANHDYFLLCT